MIHRDDIIRIGDAEFSLARAIQIKSYINLVAIGIDPSRVDP